MIVDPNNLLRDSLTDELNARDLSGIASNVIEDEYRGYFLDPAGKDHYRLLTYISDLCENQTVLDIGTYKGCSALALSYNHKTTVFTFDIGSFWALHSVPRNVTRVVDNVLYETYLPLIRLCPFILLDTAHEGPFEREFHSYLQTIGWKGTLMLDDIHLNPAMESYWADIQEEKVELPRVGHWSGTGLVMFR